MVTWPSGRSRAPNSHWLLSESKTPVEGKSSEQLAAIPIDTTPPIPPGGLIAVPQKEGIELDWFPNQEADLLGYNVYRQEEPGTDLHKITENVIKETYFLDLDTQRGKTYSYTVTAVDNSPYRNESPPSRSTSVKY